MTIRSARPEDANFIANTILSSQRGCRPRGWFDVALGWPEPQCLDFIARIAVARAVSMWHVSQFLTAEVDGEPGAKAGFVFAEEKRDPAFEALIAAPGYRR